MEPKNACRNILVTRNNPDIPAQDYLQMLYTGTCATYCCGQLERGDNGTIHIQAFVNFKKPQRFSKIHKVDKKAACIEVKVNNGAHDYCMKEDTRIEGPWEFGTKPVQRNNKTDWAKVMAAAKTGNIQDIPDDIQVRYYGNLQKIAKDSLKPLPRPDIRALWIYGDSGLGKSYLAEKLVEEFPGAHYEKKRTKWWDGYHGHKTVVLHDLDKYNVELGGDLKDWSDRYPLLVETKGGAIPAQWNLFIVTSQYSIQEIFEKDNKTIEALERRFDRIYLSRDNGQLEITVIRKPIDQEPDININHIRELLNL